LLMALMVDMSLSLRRKKKSNEKINKNIKEL